MAKLKLAFLFIAMLGTISVGFSQTCKPVPNTVGSSANLSSLTWSGTGVSAATCAAIANGTDVTTTANFNVDLANGVTLTFDKSITVNGNFVLTNSGTSTVDVPSNVTVVITGNFGNAANNNANFIIDGDLNVGGTFSGKNSNSFSGTGSCECNLDYRSAGGGAQPTCGSPCSISFTGTCLPAGGSWCTTIAPIKLSSFTSKVNGQAVELNWTTSSEINFDYFSIQKSANGVDFAEISQVKGNGTTSEAHSYQYEDTNPFVGRNYYRLTSVDFDNYQEIFKVIKQDYSGSKDLYVSYSSDRSIVDLNFNFESATGALIIYDNIGSPVGSYEVNGVGTMNLNNHLKSGIYVAKYSSGSFNKTLRFAIK